MQQDGQLMERAAAGDSAALRELLERYGRRVADDIRARIGRQWQAVIDADDVMQVTYMEAFLQIRHLNAREGAAFVGWLRRIAENNLRDAIKELERKKRPHPARRVQSPPGEESYVALIDLLGASGQSPSRHVAGNEAARILESMLEHLPPDYRTAIRLYDLEELSIEEVAEKMGRSRGAVHMLRARAHDRLRALLGSETDFFSNAP